MENAILKLDRRTLRDLAPGQKVTSRGITFERLPNGDGLYVVNVMVDGQRIHRVIGRESEGVTRTQAEQFIEKIKTDARHDRLTLPKGRKVALSFSAAADKYLQRMEETGGKNIKAKRQHLNMHLVPFFAGRPLSKIATFDIERYKKKRLSDVVQAGGDRISGNRKDRETGRTTAPGTINRELATLSHLFNRAAEWGWITATPKIKRLTDSSGRIVYLNSQQAQRFLEACRDSPHPQLFAFVRVALATGMRKSEILSIQVKYIDLDRKMIHVPQAKAGARQQPITDDLAAFLARYLQESIPAGAEWLFPSPTSASGHTVAIEKPFRAAAVAAGLDPVQVTRHTLRHTAVSHLVQAGVDLPTVARVSGHKTLSMVQKYAHQDGAHIAAAMDKLQQRLGEKSV